MKRIDEYNSSGRSNKMSKEYLCVAYHTRWVDNPNGADYTQTDVEVFYSKTKKALIDQLSRFRYETHAFNIEHNQAYLTNRDTYRFSPIYELDASLPPITDDDLKNTKWFRELERVQKRVDKLEMERQAEELAHREKTERETLARLQAKYQEI